jgi:hypothetical protein
MRLEGAKRTTESVPPSAQITPGWSLRSMVMKVSKLERPTSVT